jgi:hypothetical protein
MRICFFRSSLLYLAGKASFERAKPFGFVPRHLRLGLILQVGKGGLPPLFCFH